MKAENIQVGDVLILKPARRAAYDWPNDGIVVAGIKIKPGYKTPWILTSEGYAFTPSDFAKRA